MKYRGIISFFFIIIEIETNLIEENKTKLL